MPCPYQIVCKDCPGGEDYEPDKGTIAQGNGIRCLDFNRFLPYRLAFQQRKLPGPRHLPNIVERIEKLDAAARRYAQSDKGRLTQRRWNDSEKGQESAKKHQQTETFKLTQQKYRESKKGKDTAANTARLKRQWRKIMRWLKENPSKTYGDYFKEHPKERIP